MKSGNILLVTNSNDIKLSGKVYIIITKNFNRISPKEDTLYHLQEHILNTLENAINKIAVKAIDDKDEATILRQVVPAHDAFPDKVRFMPWFNKAETSWKYLYYLHTNNLQRGMPVVTANIGKNYMNMSVEQIRKQDSSIYQQVLTSCQSKGSDTQQMRNVLPMIDHYFKTYSTNDHLCKLTEASNLVYNNNATPAQLNTALGWMKRATQIQESSSNYELMSKLLYRLNRKPEAVNTMQTAIDKADNPGDKNRLTLLYNNMKENQKI